jgi:hypothetical protein
VDSGETGRRPLTPPSLAAISNGLGGAAEGEQAGGEKAEAGDSGIVGS